MGRNGLGSVALDLLDTLQSMIGTHRLGHDLCDTFAFTAGISVCVHTQECQRAFRLLNQMKQRGVECSVHTYTALMNTCIKCGQPRLALDSYNMLLADGLQPNTITFNTLVDVYGKIGHCDQALRVLDIMKESVEPHSGSWQPGVTVFVPWLGRSTF